MRVSTGRDGWYLCDWNYQPDHEYVELRASDALARQWANQLRGDAFALYALRSLVGGGFPPLSDDQIVREVAWRLTSGVWLARRPVVEWVPAGSGRPPEEAAPFSREERRPAPQPQTSSPAPDAPLFPGDVDAVAIAEAQKQAAALGVPFCEECLKAQLAAAR